MALNTCEMWSNGVKIAFHFKNLQQIAQWKIENSPPHRKTAPPQTFGFPSWAEQSVSKSVKTFFVLETTWFWAKKSFKFEISTENSVSKSVNFFFFFWRPPDFGRKKPLNFRGFREISSQFSCKPSETDSRAMKIRVKVVCTLLTLSK